MAVSKNNNVHVAVLILCALFLQMAVPEFLQGKSFWLSLICDDIADVLIGLALVFTIASSFRILRSLALAYSVWGFYALLNNVAVEADLSNMMTFKIIIATGCAFLYTFLIVYMIRIQKIYDKKE